MIAAIVLAAGESKRFGRAKQLALVDGKPLLQRVLDTIRSTRIDEVVVVLGAHADAILEKVRFANERLVVNHDYAAGMSTSIRAGIAGIAATDAEAAFFVLADQPFVRSSTYDRMIDEYRRTSAKILIPLFDGRRGNPVLIDRSIFAGVAQLPGDSGFRALFSKDAVSEIAVDDRGVIDDVDTPADLQC